jgi:UDP-GlcNAc:undecaprenyl-phosphate GlcNAc-1-phosphate transferase
MLMHSDLLALFSVVLVICILVTTQLFGHVEFQMLTSRLKSIGSGLMLSAGRSGASNTSFRLQGTRQWDLLWQSLTEHADKLQMVEVKLDINLAAIQEGYHASWRRRSKCERSELWRTEVPIFADKHVVGRLTIVGEHDRDVLMCDAIGRLMEFMATIEAEIIALASRDWQAAPADADIASASPAPAANVLSHGGAPARQTPPATTASST